MPYLHGNKFICLLEMAQKQATLTGLWKRGPENVESTSDANQPLVTNSTSAEEEAPLAKKSRKRFQSEWPSDFKWLRYDAENNSMHCINCEGADHSLCSKTKSAFVKGTKNYQKSALKRHEASDEQ